MATSENPGLSVAEVPPFLTFVDDKCGGDVSGKVISDVLEGAKKCFEDDGLGEEMFDKFKALWIAKLNKLKDAGCDLNEMAAMDQSTEAPVIQLAAASSGARPKTKTGTKAANKRGHKKRDKDIIRQLDGPNDTSDDEDEDELDKDDDDEEDDDDDDDDDNDDDALADEEDGEEGGVEDEPLGSEDDISDEDPSDLFDTENVVVCQYDKITRARNKWKFHLKDGIMNLNGKDYVFQRATGDAEW